MPAFIKPRSLPRSLSQQGQRAMAASSRGSFKIIEGQYANWYPNREVALWFAICPDQAWTFDLYNRESGEVERLEDQYYYAYVNHRVAVNKRNFVCSAGAHKDKPCWGCGIRNHFYEEKRRFTEERGYEPKGEAPISAMLQYAFAGVLLEPVAKVPVLDNKGKVRRNKKGEEILRDTAIQTLEPKEREGYLRRKETSFGLRVHYSTGKGHFNTLLGFDDELRNKCASCAKDLYAMYMGCPQCGDTIQQLDIEGNFLQGQTLREYRDVEYECSCGYSGTFVPLIECECGDPVEGRLLDFAVKLISEKISDTQTNLKIAGIRTLKHFTEKYPHVQEMLDNPLKLDEIFAPTRLESQTYLIPEGMRGDGISPAPRPPKQNAQPLFEEYPLSGDGDESDGNGNDHAAQ